MLILATDEQKIERDLLAHEAWGQGLSPEGFAERERRLRAQAWASEVMLTWLLVDEGGQILASCETFRMESALYPKSGTPIKGSTYGVASVFTEPRLRGRRYASTMMGLLPEALVARDPKALSIILFSDVGPAIYARVGFVQRPAFDWVFEPLEGDPEEGVELVGEDEIGDALSVVPKPASGFVVWPTAGQIDWHLERERVYSTLLGGDRPTGSGARAGGSVALWACNFKSKELFILLLHANGTRELQAIVRSARRTAHRVGLSRVRIWEQPVAAPWPQGPEGFERRPRDGGLPMLRPLDPRVSPEDWEVIPKALWV
ncbi:MAG: N-acetyltransferase [Polyangiaceae bacterium]|nr:N-acetyltransferase [Polyangiaceae bacterium]